MLFKAEPHVLYMFALVCSVLHIHDMYMYNVVYITHCTCTNGSHLLNCFAGSIVTSREEL